MKRVFIPFASLLAVCCTSTPESHVNPLIGTEVWQGGIAIAGHEEASGYTFPGVTEPFGMTEWTAHTLPDKNRGHSTTASPIGMHTNTFRGSWERIIPAEP